MINWRWKYFTRDELKCKGTGELVINEDALDKLERMREIIGAPFKINSAYRSPTYNKKIGGAKNSMHVQGCAFDVSNLGHNPAELYQAAVKAGFTGFGFARTYLHVDTGKPRWWEYGKGYRNKYVAALPISLKANSIEKEKEAPHKIEGAALSDKQKIAVATTGVAGAGTIATAITDPQIIIEHAPSAIAAFFTFLRSADWRVALAVILILGLGALIWRIKR